MIENFTAEELETIKKELGFYDKRVKLDNGVKHRQRIEKMLAGKPFAGHVLTSDKGVIWCIGFLASCVFNNFSKR